MDELLPTLQNVSPVGDTMLVTAIVNGHFSLADFLLNKGADPNASGTRWPPLHALVRIRNYEESQYPAPKTAEGDLDSLELARRLLAHGADPNAKAATKTARRNPGDMNYTEFKGATPFFLAAKAGDIPMLRLLLSVKADYTTPIDEHTTPLMVAAGVGCVPGQWIEPERDISAAVKTAGGRAEGGRKRGERPARNRLARRRLPRSGLRDPVSGGQRRETRHKGCGGEDPARCRLGWYLPGGLHWHAAGDCSSFS